MLSQESSLLLLREREKKEREQSYATCKQIRKNGGEREQAESDHRVRY